MKLLAFAGSPRKGGNSDVLLAAFLDGAIDAGAEVESYRLSEYKIHPCIGCGGCDKTGVCVIKDDMHLFYDKIVEAKRIVLASPIYFYGLTSQMKAFIDRFQALWSRKYLLKKQGKLWDSSDAYGFLLSVAATKGPRVFEGAILCARYAFDAFGMQYAGEFTVRGMDEKGALRKQDEILAKARMAGREFVLHPAKC